MAQIRRNPSSPFSFFFFFKRHRRLICTYREYRIPPGLEGLCAVEKVSGVTRAGKRKMSRNNGVACDSFTLVELSLVGFKLSAEGVLLVKWRQWLDGKSGSASS